MSKSIWRRNDLIYMPRKKKEKKNGDGPTPPTGQGDIFLLSYINHWLQGDVGVVRGFFRGYQSFRLGVGTVNNRFAYLNSGIISIDVLMWVDNNGASGIQSLHWMRRNFGKARLLVIPQSGSDLYLVSYYGEEEFTVQDSNFTTTGTGQTATMTFPCTRFAPQFATNLDGELSRVSGYGSGSCFVLFVGTDYSTSIDDTSLLSIANSALKYYATGQTLTNIIRV